MPRDKAIDLEELARRAILDPEDDDDDDEDGEPSPAEARPAGTKSRKRVQRLSHLRRAFSRLPMDWLDPASPQCLYSPPAQLRHLLLYKSHWGRKAVVLTRAVAAEIGMSPRSKNRNLLVLERKGLVRVERNGKSAPTVWSIIPEEDR